MTRIRVRRDTSADWTEAGSVPAAGEPVLTTDHQTLAVGDGTSEQPDLVPIAAPLSRTTGVGHVHLVDGAVTVTVTSTLGITPGGVPYWDPTGVDPGDEAVLSIGAGGVPVLTTIGVTP